MKILKVVLIILLFALAFDENVFSQSWIWSKVAGGGSLYSFQEEYSTATDRRGNLYVTGFFTSASIRFGSIMLTNPYPHSDSMINLGGDVFLTKYDRFGNVLWAKIANGLGYGSSVTTDSKDNVILTGLGYSPQIIFDSDTINGSLFLVKFDSSGRVIWGKGAMGYGQGTGIATDKYDNIYLTGNCGDSLNLDSIHIKNQSDSLGGNDVFLAKYSSSGKILWAFGLVGNFDEYTGPFLSATKNGDIYLSGQMIFFMIFNSDTIYSDDFSGAFLSKYNSDGKPIWTRACKGTGFYDNVYSVCTDKFSNVYIIGSFDSAYIQFGANILNNTNPYTDDIFFVKYDSSGNVIWAKSGGGDGNDAGYSLALDTLGNIYITGGFINYGGPIKFDSIALSAPLGWNDPMFILKLSANGNALCGSTLTSGGDDQCTLSTDAFGDVFVGGDFYNVNPFVVGLDTLTLTSGETIFVSKYDCLIEDGIVEQRPAKSLIVYPNPSSAYLNISLSSKSSLTIYNLFGKQIYNEITEKNIQEVNVSLFSNGIYFLRVKSENSLQTLKFIVQH